MNTISPKTEPNLLDNESHYSCWVVFIISAPDLHPGFISKLLEMNPDRSTSPGPNQPGEWQLNSKLEANESINDHIKHLLGILMPLRRKIREIRHDSHLELFCAVRQTSEVPLIKIQPQSQLLCGHLGVHLHIELESDEN